MTHVSDACLWQRCWGWEGMSRQHANKFYVHAHSMHSVVCIQWFGQTNIDQDLIVRVRLCTVGKAQGTRLKHTPHIYNTLHRDAQQQQQHEQSKGLHVEAEPFLS